LIHGELTERIIGAAISVHREIGPGLSESAYQRCFHLELEEQRIPFKREVQIPLIYKNIVIPDVYRIDFLIDGRVIVELKAIDKLAPIHTAQIMTYQRMTRIRVGLLFNFNVDVLIHGMRRILL
jgi:GxxExxY protein